MDAAGWDARYAETAQVWSPDPNAVVVQALGERPPGAALDLGAGEGRHALWLALRGWTVTAVDFSAQAISKVRARQEQYAPETAGRIEWVHGDVLTDPPTPGAYDAVVVMYLHLRAAERRRVLRGAARALASGGDLLVVGHDTTNLTDGVGGPQDAAVLFTADDVLEDLLTTDGAGAGLTDLTVLRAERIERVAEAGTALDAVALLRRT